MDIVYSEDHRLHCGQGEMVDGEQHPCFENPSRADTVLAAVKRAGIGQVLPPEDFGLEPILAIHGRRYVDFLQHAWDRWAAQGCVADLLPTIFHGRHSRGEAPVPTALMGELGHYCFDSEAPVTSGTWQAIYSSAQVALTAQQLMAQGARSAFALCRPPGHHAGSDYMGGYCYFNNAAIAGQRFLDQGARRVAILDIDYHHGNGTQEIFYGRGDVLFASIHADPMVEYPYYWGHESERGEGAGEGFNCNYPLPHGAGWAQWSKALADACAQIEGYGADALIISLGVDTYEQDPISEFRLTTPDYRLIGEAIGALGLPTLFVMEGGYAVEAIGLNVSGVLEGFLGRP